MRYLGVHRKWQHPTQAPKEHLITFASNQEQRERVKAIIGVLRLREQPERRMTCPARLSSAHIVTSMLLNAGAMRNCADSSMCFIAHC